MSSSSWRRLLILGLLAVLIFAGAAGFLTFQSLRGRNALAAAEEAYANERWVEAKRNYTWYIARNPDDLEVFPRYIESCLNILNNRRENVRDAGRAYLKLALAEPSNLALAQQVVDFYRDHNLWRDLDYAASVFLRNHPEDPVLIYNRALADGLLGRTSEAIAGYRQLADRGDAQAEAYGNLAQLLLKQGYQEQGWQLLDDAVAERPGDPLLRAERVKYALAVRDIVRATAELERALEAGADAGEVLLAAASVHAAKQDFETSLAYAQDAVHALPASHEGHALIAKNFIALRKTGEAIDYLSTLDAFFLADNPRLYLLLAEIQIDAQALEDAGRTIETYRAVAPHEREMLDYLDARKLLEAGDAAEAASKFAIVVERMPELSIARYYLSIAYLESGNRDRAKNALELYITNNPEDRRAQLLRDSVFAERTAESIESEARDLLSSDAPYFASLLSVANSLFRSAPRPGDDVERLELTERLYRRAIEDSPSVPDAYSDLALHLLSQDKQDAARQVLDEAFAAGIPPADLDYPAAAIALADGDVARAKTLFAERVERERIGFGRAEAWITLFAAAGHMAAGLEILDTVRSPDHPELDLVEVAVLTQFGNVEQAHERSIDLADRYADAPGIIARLNDYRIALARLTMTPGANKNRELTEQLAASIERTEPDRADALALRAQLLLQQTPPGLEAAERLCAKASERAPDDMYVLLVSSEIAYLRGQFSKAADYAQAAHEVSSNRVYTGVILARMQLQMGAFSDALATLQDADRLAPDNPAIVELMVRANAGLGRFREADDLTRQLQTLLDGQLPVQLQATLLIARGDWPTAEQVLRRMHEVNPADIWSMHYLAVAMEQQDRWDEAEQFLNACIDRHPDLDELWITLGKSYLRNADNVRLADASLAFTQALTRNPDDHRAIRGMFEVQIRSGNLGAALGFCDRLLREIPDDYDMIRQKAMLLARIQGREQEALASVNRAIDMRPLTDLYYLRGRLHLELGEPSSALKDFQFVEQSGADMGGELDVLMAEAYLDLDNLQLARSYYDAARARAPQLHAKTIARLNRLADRMVQNE
jgi:tetratricopeptide (TPR) repeat protein